MADPGVLQALLGTATRLRASPKERKALIEAGLVESGIHNLPYGDRDSLGVLQERTSIYGRSHALSPVASAERFLRQAHQANRPGLSAGALAQAVQRSAFPERYDQRSGQAEQILGSQGGRGGGGVGPGVQGSVTVSPGAAPGFDAGNGASDPGVLAGLLQQPQAPPPLQVQAPNSALKYLTGSGNVPSVQAPAPRVDVGALAGLLQPSEGLPEAQGQAPRVNVHVSPTATASAAGGRLHGNSKLLELFYNGPGGINVKNGQREPRGFVTGHTDHVHVAAGPKTIVQVGELAQQMGLHVGENPHFGGVNPVHVPGSYHYKGEAIDVSGTPAQMRRFNNLVARKFGVGR